MFIEVTTRGLTGHPSGTVLLNSNDISVIRSNGSIGCDIYLISDTKEALSVCETFAHFSNLLK